MASLEDFAPKPRVSLADFQVEPGSLVHLSNEPSNINLAAYTASLSEDPNSVESTYLRIAEDLSREGSSKTGQYVQDRARSIIHDRSQGAFIAALTDPDLSDEEKRAIAEQYMDEKSSLYNLRDIVATESLIDPVDEETVESETARVSFAGMMEEVSELNRYKNTRLTLEMNKNNQGFMKNLLDFVEIILPFTEGSVAGRTVSEMRDGDGFAVAKGLAWMGGSKAEIRDALSKLPIAERRQAIEKIISSANESSGIVFSDTNEFARAEMLRVALETGAYGQGEEWLDNAISVLDMLGVFGGVVRGVRAIGGRIGRRIGKSSRIEPPTTTAERAASETPYVQDAPPREPLATPEGMTEIPRAEPFERTPLSRAVSGEDTPTPVGRKEQLERMEAVGLRPRRQARLTEEEIAEVGRLVEDRAAYRARTEAAKAPVQPTSLASTYRNTNPTKARALSQMAAEDATGTAARAGYGASRVDAVVHDHLPEVKQLGGEVKNKVSMPDTTSRPGPMSPRVMDYVNKNGALYLTDEQKVAVATRVVNDFNNAVGLTTRTEMTVPPARDIGGKVSTSVTYGARDSGFDNAADAVEKVKTSLRQYGVADEDITVLARQGDDYVPVSREAAREPGDYLIQVDYDYPIAANDITKMGGWNVIDIMNNFLDRMPHMFGGKAGTVQRHLLDPASMFDKHILFAATNAVFRSAGMEKILSEIASSFGKSYNKLSKPMKEAFEAEIKRANLEGYNNTWTALRANGWDEQGFSALKLWREAWDQIYHLENFAFIKSLRNKGYGVLEDAATDTRLFARELTERGAGTNKRVYDPSTGELRNMDADAIRDHYEKGGTIGKLRSKFLVDEEEAAEFVLSSNQPGSSYIRRLRDDDQVLNYREGYYSVYYDAPKIVEKVVRNSRGDILFTKAVSTAKDSSSADRMINRLSREAEGTNVEYRRRDSRERQRFDSEDNWNLQESSGRLAHRARGERLEDASSPITDEMHNHILGPADALIRSIRNVSPNVMMRDAVDAMKERGIAMYGHMFPIEDGRRVFPGDSGTSSIKAGEAYGSEAADARSFVEYVNSLERSYFNAMDDGIKYFFRAMADASAERGLSVLERAANFAAETARPMGTAKGVAFTLYLALNPLRQLVVQGHQATQLLALRPGYVLGQLHADAAAMIMRRAGGDYKQLSSWAEMRPTKELDDMYEAFEKSGMSAAVDKSNLIRGSLQEVADATAMGGYRGSPVARVAGLGARGIAASRVAGFDTGERINRLTSWLTHYDIKKQEVGARKLTQSEIDEVTARAENWIYNMSRAGEMPYNENHFGLVAQFIQVPHKAFLTMTTNRHLSWKEKSRLIAFNALFYGAPPGSLIYATIGDKLPQDGDFAGAGEVREAFLQGLEAYMFNRIVGGMYNFVSGDKKWQDIDFSSLVAVDGEGLYEFITDLMTTDVGEIVANSPAGSLFMGNSPRVANAIKKVAEYFHFKEPDDQNRAQLGEVLLEVAKMSSGFSNAYKARQIMKYEKKYNSSGGVLVDNAPTPTAIAQAWGMNTVEEARRYYVSGEMYEMSTAFQDDAKERYRLFKQDLFREGITQDEREFVSRAMNYINEEVDTIRGREITLQQLRFDVQAGDDSLMRQILNSVEWAEEKDLRSLINNSPIDPDRKQELHGIVDDVKRIQSQE